MQVARNLLGEAEWRMAEEHVGICSSVGDNATKVGSSHPGAGVGPKGWAVRPLKRHASWVQNVVRQFGLYPLWALEGCEGLLLVREDRSGPTSGVPVVDEAPPGSYVGLGELLKASKRETL